MITLNEVPDEGQGWIVWRVSEYEFSLDELADAITSKMLEFKEVTITSGGFPIYICVNIRA